MFSAPSASPAPVPKQPAGARARELLALLEFLGSFENADGDWIDPFILDDPVFEKTRSAEKEPGDE